jgi:hypothetical protein
MVKSFNQVLRTRPCFYQNFIQRFAINGFEILIGLKICIQHDIFAHAGLGFLKIKMYFCFEKIFSRVGFFQTLAQRKHKPLVIILYGT